MIKTKQGEVFAKGSVVDLLVDLSVIVMALKRAVIDEGMPENDADKCILKSVEDGLASIGYEKSGADTCRKDRDPVDEAIDQLFYALFHGCVRKEK